jgi:uncharacterized protein (DUF924 family)
VFGIILTLAKQLKMNPKDIIDFWSNLSEAEWFSEGKNLKLDNHIIQVYGNIHSEACAGNLSDWKNTLEGRFALILLFDQFTRHIYRYDPINYFINDEKARDIAIPALEAIEDLNIKPELRRFYFFPLMHSENISDILIAKQFAANRNNQRMIGFLDKNINILNSFGRYPWRNAFLKRKTTKEEYTWLLTTEEGKHRLNIELHRHDIKEWQ